MRRVCCSVAMSLDRYVSGPNSENDWIIMDPDLDFRALVGAFDAVLLGRKTYEATRQHGAVGTMRGMRACVFSRTLRQTDCPDATVSDNPAETVPALKAKSGKDIWSFGGGSLFRSLLELGLVDAVEAAIIPVLLGGGLPHARSTIQYQDILDRMDCKHPPVEDNIYPMDGDQKPREIQNVTRDEIDNADELITLLENGKARLVELAPSAAEEGILPIGPDIVGQLRKKVRIMLLHQLDVYRLYRRRQG